MGSSVFSWIRPDGFARAAYRGQLLARGPGGPGAVRVAWLGTAGLMITDGETTLLIDPFVSRYGLARVALGWPLPPRQDLVDAWVRRLGAGNTAAVLVTHSHYDHAMDAPFFARATGAVLAGSESTANIGRGAGIDPARLRVVAPGHTLGFGRFEVTFVESRHGPSPLGGVLFPGNIDRPVCPPAAASAYRLGTTFSLVLRHPAGTLVHHGSAGDRAGMYDGVRADVVFLGLAGRKDTDAYVAAVVDAVGARRVIPLHFDDFFKGLDRPFAFLAGVGFSEFVRTVRRTRPRLEVTTLPVGEPVVVLGGDVPPG